MLKNLRIIATLALLFGAAAAAAQDIDQIMARIVEANGGEENLRAAATVFMDGTMTGMRSGKTVPFKIHMMDGVYRQEMTGLQVQAFDGRVYWIANQQPNGSAAYEVYEGDAAESSRRAARLNRPFLDFDKNGLTVTLRGTEEENGRLLYVIDYTYKDGIGDFAMKYDAETYLPVWIDFGGGSGNKFLDFRSVAGVMYPFRLESYDGEGNLLYVNQNDEIIVNQPMSSALFTMPEEGRRAATKANGAAGCSITTTDTAEKHEQR